MINAGKQGEDRAGKKSVSCYSKTDLTLVNFLAFLE